MMTTKRYAYNKHSAPAAQIVVAVVVGLGSIFLIIAGANEGDARLLVFGALGPFAAIYLIYNYLSKRNRTDGHCEFAITENGIEFTKNALEDRYVRSDMPETIRVPFSEITGTRAGNMVAGSREVYELENQPRGMFAQCAIVEFMCHGESMRLCVNSAEIGDDITVVLDALRQQTQKSNPAP